MRFYSIQINSNFILQLFKQITKQQLCMKQVSKIFTKIAFRFSKRVISMKPAQVNIFQEKPAELNKMHAPVSSTTLNQSIPENWQTMGFDQLCSLDSSVLHKIQLMIKKTKMNVTQQLFSSDKHISNPQVQLQPYWVDIFKTFCNMKSISSQKMERIQSNAYLAKMFFDEPEADEKLLQIVEKFVNNIHEVKQLEGIAEATFCKYLLSLKRDLKMQGLDLDSYIDPKKKEIKILKALSYQYQFWVDIKHNRSKNGRESDFIVIKKTIDNPNTTMLITEQFPKIVVTYITRKKKRQHREMNFVIKTLLEIEVNGLKHVVKVQKKGPSSAKEEKQLRNQYLVIDYDGIYKGNPTIRPIFQF